MLLRDALPADFGGNQGRGAKTQREFQIGSRFVNREFLFVVTHVRNEQHQRKSGPGAQFESAVEVRDRAVGRTFHLYVGSDQGLARCFVDDHTSHGFLRQNSAAGKKD